MSEYPFLLPRDNGSENPALLRLAWLVGGSSAEEWLAGENYPFAPNPAVREACEILAGLDVPTEK